MEAKSFILNQSNVTLKSVMEECLSIFNFKATEKRIGLFIDKKAFNELPREIYTDGIRLK